MIGYAFLCISVGLVCYELILIRIMFRGKTVSFYFRRSRSHRSAILHERGCYEILSGYRSTRSGRSSRPATSSRPLSIDTHPSASKRRRQRIDRSLLLEFLFEQRTVLTSRISRLVASGLLRFRVRQVIGQNYKCVKNSFNWCGPYRGGIKTASKFDFAIANGRIVRLGFHLPKKPRFKQGWRLSAPKKN